MLRKKELVIPRGIEFISEWKDYVMPEGHCIVNKGVTGCGYTEMCIRNDLNVVLCSPRRLLLENKAEQHLNDENVLYLENNKEAYLSVKENFEKRITDHLYTCKKLDKPVKFLITYDSVNYVIENLSNLGLLKNFYFVADEFQAIFTDSYLKAEVEDKFVESLKICPNVIYLSATPMMDKYLEQVDEFKDLTYYNLNWVESGYVENIKIQRKHTRSLGSEADKIIQQYLIGDYPIIITEDSQIIKSKEAVFYVNSISEIIKILNRNKLTPEQCNILCSNQPDNLTKLKKVNKNFCIGKVPLKGERNKMFTFCTSTCYIGSDFWSDNASTYIFADPNLKCLALDISLDLPQIAGRQRNRNNPFKNYITIFYKTLRGENIESREEFEKIKKERIERTEISLNLYNKGNDEEKKEFIRDRLIVINSLHYSDKYLSVNKEGKPVYNKFIELADERAWEVAQKDYQDSINVTKALLDLEITESSCKYEDADDKLVEEFLSNKFYKTNNFEKQMKLFCEFMDKNKNNRYIIDILQIRIPDPKFRSYYNFFGTEGCRANSYKESNLRSKLLCEIESDKLTKVVLDKFKLNERISKKDIKESLKGIYQDLSLSKAAKATDIEEWFEVKAVVFPVNGKMTHGFELLALKKN